ncbi:MAG: PorV/PorQ family protein [Calditrichota bacterium]
MKKYIIALLLLLCSLPLSAQSAGTTAFDFLKADYSSRGAAMANNLLAIRQDVNAMFYNPAGLYGMEQSQWSGGYVDHLLDFQAGQFLYARPTTGLGIIGLGVIYFDYGSFDQTDEFGDATGENFSASEFALAMSISNTLGDGFSYGLNLKYIYSSLDTYNAAGVALDAGLIYDVPLGQDLRFGISLANVGLVYDTYTDVDDKMPINLSMGFSKKLAHLPLLFSAALNDITLSSEDNVDVFKRFSVGGEFDVSTALKFRIGYDNNVNQSVRPLSGRNFGGVSAGLGLAVKSFRIDYAFSSGGDLGNQNRFGLTGSF